MNTFTFTAQTREDLGKGASRRLRHADSIPAIIYGGELDPQAVTLNHNDVLKSLEHESIYTSIVTVKVGDTEHKTIIRDIQRHSHKPKVLHVDFQRISQTEKIHMPVPIHFIGGENAPGVKTGGQMTHNMNEIEVSCLAKDLPSYIELDVSTLEIGDTLHISDLQLPEGVSSVALAHGEDYDQPVVAINKSRGMSDDDSESSEEETEES